MKFNFKNLIVLKNTILLNSIIIEYNFFLHQLHINYFVNCFIISYLQLFYYFLEIIFFMKKMLQICYDYEHSELLLYQNMLIQESGDSESALKHLDKNIELICDKVTVKETYGTYQFLSFSFSHN